MANRIVSVHAGIYGMGIYAIMLPSSGFSVAHWDNTPTILYSNLTHLSNHGRFTTDVEMDPLVTVLPRSSVTLFHDSGSSTNIC